MYPGQVIPTADLTRVYTCLQLTCATAPSHETSLIHIGSWLRISPVWVVHSLPRPPTKSLSPLTVLHSALNPLLLVPSPSARMTQGTTLVSNILYTIPVLSSKDSILPLKTESSDSSIPLPPAEVELVSSVSAWSHPILT